MAVVVKYNEKGDAEIKSLNGVGIPPEERNKAFSLDALIKKEITALVKRLKKDNALPKARERGKVDAYWEFGSVLRNIFLNSGLIKPSEKSLYYESVKYHTGLLAKSLLAEDRSNARNHLEYCYRLSGYQKEIANELQWSEWVFLLDSSSINKEIRFDDWFRNIIKQHKEILNRESLRAFAKVLNSLIKDIETSDWNNEQLLNCYNGAWKILLFLRESEPFKENDSRKKLLESIKQCAQQNKNLYAQLLDGKISDDEFAKKICECCYANSSTSL
jgi:hypothetical protein